MASSNSRQIKDNMGCCGSKQTEPYDVIDKEESYARTIGRIKKRKERDIIQIKDISDLVL
jgi:hypothetical protein